MSVFSQDVLSVIGEAVVIARGGKIIFCNAPAAAILGGDNTGKKLAAVFGANIAGAQADEFTANLCLRGKNCIVRSSRRSGEQILTITEVRADIATINDAFLYSLRSSLMAVSMAAERVRKLAGDSGGKELLTMSDSMSKSLASAFRLISNISDVCGLRAQTIRFSPKTTDVSRLFREYTDVAASLLPEVEISFEAPEGLQTAVDTDLIKHLFSNLISNAVLHGRCRKISVRLLDNAEYVILAVNDDGCGIPSDELYNVFERYLGVLDLTDIVRGTGLGLSVVMGTARLHGGTVLLESSASHGTAVRVSLKKNIAGATLYAPVPATEDVRELLIGLADCVDEQRFREADEEF